MGTEVLKSCDSLQEELEKAKTNLKGLNDNIRRIIGRDPQDQHLRTDRKRSFNDTRRNNDFSNFNNPEKQKPRDLSPTPPTKRRPQEAKSVFSRLSGPSIRGDDEIKPRMHSRVIRELPTRQEIVEAQGVDEQSRARNKRMFGCLLGTLQKFCQEESRLKPKEEMKAQIEKKLEAQEIQERENLKKERQTLFVDRKRQQLEIRKLELKMLRLREFEIWEKSKKDLYNFLRTKSKPFIYYRPKILNDKINKKLNDCRLELDKEIEKRRSEVNDEILLIEDRFKFRADYANENKKKFSTITTKHDRRQQQTTNYEDDEEHDSAYEHSDEEQQQHYDKDNDIKPNESKTNIDNNQLENYDQTKHEIIEQTSEENSQEPHDNGDLHISKADNIE